MLKCKLDCWKIRAAVKEDQSRYEVIKEIADAAKDSIGTLEDYLNEKSYSGLDFWVNDLEVLPNWLIPLITMERPEVYRIIKPDGNANTGRLMEAIKMNQVHLPNNVLLQISEVTWMENSCTEELQKMLDDGWRIIAVCIQAGQRRPDYVLGKPKGGFNIENSY